MPAFTEEILDVALWLKLIALLSTCWLLYVFMPRPQIEAPPSSSFKATAGEENLRSGAINVPVINPNSRLNVETNIGKGNQDSATISIGQGTPEPISQSLPAPVPVPIPQLVTQLIAMVIPGLNGRKGDTSGQDPPPLYSPPTTRPLLTASSSYDAKGLKEVPPIQRESRGNRYVLGQ